MKDEDPLRTDPSISIIQQPFGVLNWKPPNINSGVKEKGSALVRGHKYLLLRQFQKQFNAVFKPDTFSNNQKGEKKGAHFDPDCRKGPFCIFFVGPCSAFFENKQIIRWTTLQFYQFLSFWHYKV